MVSPTYHSPWSATITFSTMIKAYIKMQSQLVKAVRDVASRISQATPGKFLLLQFQMLLHMQELFLVCLYLV